MKTLKGFLVALVLLVAGLAGSTAQAQTYYGYNPVTGLEVMHGSDVSGGNAPVFTFSAGCGTVTANKAGAYAGTFTLGTFATSCTVTLTFPGAVTGGWYCVFGDQTTAAGVLRQASNTTTQCVTAASTTVVTGDVIVWTAVGFTNGPT